MPRSPGGLWGWFLALAAMLGGKIKIEGPLDALGAPMGKPAAKR